MMKKVKLTGTQGHVAPVQPLLPWSVSMLPTPERSWSYTGAWPFSVFGVLAEQVEAAYPQVKFEGEGWYAAHHLLIEATGEQRNGKPTYRLSWYAVDPRQAFTQAANLPSRPKT